MGKSGGKTKEMNIEGSPRQVNINPSLKVTAKSPKLVPARHRREDTDALNAPVSSNAPWFAEIAHQRDPNNRKWAWDGYHLGRDGYLAYRGFMNSQDASLFKTCDWVCRQKPKECFLGPATRVFEPTITTISQSSRGYVPVAQYIYEDSSCVLYLFF